MKLNTKIKSVIRQLIKIDREIYKRYIAIINGINLQKSSEELLLLIQSEKALINSINLNAVQLSNIKNYVQGKSRLNLDEDLIKVSLNVDEKKYPYLRAYARIYYEFCRRKIYTDLDNTALFIDQEVLNLYRMLGYVAQMEDDENVYFASRMILLNSGVAEEEILKNNFEPVDVYDTIEFASELFTAKDIVVKRQKNVDFKADYEKITAATLSRKDEFYRIFYGLINTMGSELPKYASGDSYFKMLISYFKVIFTLLDGPSREYMYEQLRNSKVLNNSQFNTCGLLEELLSSVECDIEEILLPYCKHLSIFPF